MNPVRALTHSPDPPGGVAGGSQVNVGQLGDGMARGVVEVPRSDVPAVHVSHEPPRGGARQGPGQSLDPVPQDQHHVGARPVKKSGQTLDPPGQTDGLIQGPVVTVLHTDPGSDVPAVGRDIVQRFLYYQGLVLVVVVPDEFF